MQLINCLIMMEKINCRSNSKLQTLHISLTVKVHQFSEVQVRLTAGQQTS